jgi:ribosome-associated translation inhibitor RaiA
MTNMIPQTEGAIPFPFDIAFVDSATSPAVRAQIENQLQRLTRFYERITFARVNVRIPHKHRTPGQRQFHVHVQVDLPGRSLVASRESSAGDRNMDIHRVVRDAFLKVTRQLEDFVKTRNRKKVLGANNSPLETIKPSA